MGAEIKHEHGYVRLKAKRLKGAKIYLDISTAGQAQENLMMAATLAKTTVVKMLHASLGWLIWRNF